MLNKCLSLLGATAIIRRIVIEQVRLIFEHVFRKRKYVRKKVYNPDLFFLYSRSVLRRHAANAADDKKGEILFRREAPRQNQPRNHILLHVYRAVGISIQLNVPFRI